MIKRFIVSLIRRGTKGLIKLGIKATPDITLAVFGSVLVALILVFAGTRILFSETEIISPVNLGPVATPTPNILLANIQKDSTIERKYPPNEYFPESLTPKYGGQLSDVGAVAYGVMNRETGELLLAKNLEKRLPIASLTKVMTAVIALENAPLDLELSVSSAAAKVGEASMGLSYKEKLSLEELLYGMLLPSGNDAAETVANGLGAGRIWFLRKMNEKAQNLGMYDTYYFNPTGLDEDSQDTTTFSSVLDLLGLTNYALGNKKFADLVATRYKEIPYKEGKHKAFYLENILKLDSSYPGIKGVKPGLSDYAGETLISYLDNHEKLIAVVLGSQETKADVVKLYDFILKNKSNKTN